MLIYQISTGVGVWGNNHAGHVGLGHHQFRLVGRRRARGHVDFGDAVSDAATLAHDHRPRGGGDDRFLRDVAGLYPAIHVGRVWFDWFMFPIPTHQRHLAAIPFAADVGRVRRQHLSGRFAAVLVHGHDSRPRRAARPGSTTRVRKFLYGLFALGWTGSARQWHNYEKAYLVLCGLCTLLVFTVSSIVGLDFCTAQLAGWHATIFPLYFVIGAVFCGFGMVLVLLIPLRKWCHLEDIITMRHIDTDLQTDAGDELHHRLHLPDGIFHRVV